MFRLIRLVLFLIAALATCETTWACATQARVSAEVRYAICECLRAP